MTQSLHGLCVLNTRPQHQAADLSARIRQAGGEVIECPSLAIVPKDDSWLRQLPDLNQIDHAIFISPNAVHYAMTGLNKNNIVLPHNINIIAIGQATAKALKHYKLNVAEIPTQSNSEHLLKLACLQKLNNQTVLLFKGEGGLTLIEQGLKSRNAKVIKIDLYQRALPYIEPQFLESIRRDDKVNIIIATSEQSLNNIFTLFGTNAKTWLQNKVFLVLSIRLAEYASSLGIKKIRMSHTETIIQTLFDYLEE